MILYFVDCETTGLSPQKNTILEFCAIKHVNRVETDRLYMKIKPTQNDLFSASKYALKINGYDPEKWKDALEPQEAAMKIAKFLYGTSETALVAHNVKFDASFIRYFLKRWNTDQNLPFRTIDTVSLAFAHLKPLGLNSMKLDNIRRFLGWSLEDAHTATKDVEDCVKLFDLLVPKHTETQTVIVNQITTVNTKTKGV